MHLKHVSCAYDFVYQLGLVYMYVRCVFSTTVCGWCMCACMGVYMRACMCMYVCMAMGHMFMMGSASCRMNDSSSETFILRLYRQDNKVSS